MRRLFAGVIVAAALAAGVGALIWYRILPGLPPLRHGPAAVEEAFTREAARKSGAVGYYFRSALLSDGDSSAATGVLLSLNPGDTRVPPRIFDPAAGTLTEVERSAADLPEAKIDRVEELGPFSGGYAAARALVRRGDESLPLWGYVTHTGKWAIGPRYLAGEMPVNQWAKVNTAGDDWQIIDLETMRPVELPAGQRPCNEPLHRLGLGAWLCAGTAGQPSTAWLLSAGGGQALALPARPANEQWGDGKLILLEDGRYVERATGKVLPSLPTAEAAREMVNGLVALRDGGAWSIRDAETGAVVATGLSAAAPLTRDLFVACEQGDAARLVARQGAGDPLPLAADEAVRCGLMDREGHWRVKAQYQQFRHFDGRVVFRNGHEWCELSGKAEPVCGEGVPASLLSANLWLDADSTRDYGKSDGRYGYRDASGAIAIAFQFDRATPFVGQVAAVTRLGVPGLIDSAGKWLTPAPNDDVVALVRDGALEHPHNLCRESCWGLVNRSGEWVLPPMFVTLAAAEKADGFWITNKDADSFFHVTGSGRVLEQSRDRSQKLVENGAGKGPEISNDLVVTGVNGKWGIADAARRWILRPQYEAATVMSAQRALVKSSGLWGMVDGSGKWIVEPRYKSLDAMNESFARATVAGADGDESALIDENGAVLATDPLPEVIEPFDAGGMALAQAGKRWGWLDRKGVWVIRPFFTDARTFNGAMAPAQSAPLAGDLTSLATPRGYAVQESWTWPATKLAGASLLQEGAPKGGAVRIGLMDPEGNWLVPRPEYWRPAK